ncbi:MAG: PKD domain-containing protein [Bacteroidota bacterium]|nr:PKD domain-containing protein [Bacteroidota bacterium]
MKTIIFSILLMLGAQLGIAQTNVSGAYFTNTNWTAAGSPYNVIGDVQIPAGVTLTIAPGVLINYSGNYEILIKGSILAIGKSTSRIIFNGTASGKAMLIFKNANLSNSLINFVYFSGPKSGAEIEFGNTGTLLIKNAIIGNTTIKTNGLSTPQDSLIIDSSYITTTSILQMQTSIEIKNSTITRSDIFSNSALRFFTIRTCLVDSIILKGGNHLIVSSNVKRSKVFTEVSSLNIIDSKIEGTSIYPVFLRVINSEIKNYDTLAVIGRGVIECSTLSGTGNGVGIIVTGNGSIYGALTIRNSTIKQNRIGIIINPNWPDTSFIDSSNFVSNSIYNIQNFSPANINSKHNWWGTSDSIVIKNKIYDYYDNINSGIVNFGNRLNSIYNSSGCPGPQSQGINTCNSYYTSVRDTLSYRKFNFYPSMAISSSTAFLWDFGDNTTSTAYNPVHLFPGNSSYNVCLKTIKVMGTDSCISQNCSVINAGCKADFEWAFDAGNPAKVNFVSTSSGANLSYHWTFGQGSTSSIANPSFAYQANGNYSVCLLVQSQTDTGCNEMKCKIIIINNFGACNAQYAFLRDTINNLKIKFINQSTGDSLTYLWAFGDGIYSTLKNPEHQFSASGSYNVCLTVQKTGSTCASTFCFSFNVGPFTNTCKANFTYVSISGLFLTIGLGPRVKCSWNFGDGTLATGKNLSHKFEYAGIYQVCLYVEDSIDRSCHELNCLPIQVTPEQATNKCTPKFNNTKLVAPRKYYFSAHSNYLEDSAMFFWAFGDGDSSTNKYPTHTFAANGTYNVCLFISVPRDSCHKTYCESIIVYDSLIGIFEKENFLAKVKLYPNPFQESVQLELNSPQSDELQVMLFDMQGRECFTSNFNLLPAANHFTIDTGDLSKGIYIVKLNTSKQYHFIKLIKQ